MATFKNIGVEESATVTNKVATVQIARGSTNEQQEIMVLGDAESSLGIARILNSTPASTEYGLAVRVIEQPSTVVSVSTGSVRVHQSSAADLNVTVSGYSTTANVSSVGGIVAIRPSDTNWASSAGFHFDSSGALMVAQAVAQSTIVTVSTGSVRVHQSSAADLNVTVSGYSTTANVSSVGGIVAIRPSDTNWASSAGFHFDSSGALQIAGTFSASTTVQVSSVGGTVTIRPSDTNWASSAGFHFDSSGALQIAGTFSASTTVQVSSVGGIVAVRASDTNWASSAGFHFDSSGALQIAGTINATTSTQVSIKDILTSSGGSVMDSTEVAIKVNVVAGGGVGSTTVSVSTGSVRVHQSSAADLNVTVAGYSTIVSVSTVGGVVTVEPRATSNSSVYMPVRFTDGTSFVPLGFDYTDGSTYSSLVAPGLAFNNSSNNTFRTVGLTTPLPIQVTDSSNAAVKPGDSANNALRVNVVAGSAASTIVTVSTGSVRVHQSSAADLNVTVAGYSTTVNVSSVGGVVLSQLADRDNSTKVAAVLGADPASTTYGLIVRPVGAGAASTIVSVSTGSVRVHQSSAADLNVTVAGYSTTVNISSLAGPVIMRSSAADALVTVYQSTASALQVTATIGTNIQSTAAPSSNSSGLIVRQVVDALTAFASTSALASTTLAVTSTAAGIRAYVTAYSITTTNQTAAHWGFFSSNGTLLWPLTLAALSSGVAGANLAVAPPGYLFRTAVAEALNFKTAGSTVSGVQLGVSYYLAP